MKSMKRLLALFALISFNVLAQGQYIVSSAKISKIGNTSGNGESFWVVAVDGQGPCISTNLQTNIYFTDTAAGTQAIYERAYAMALAATMSGARVNIYNYVDSQCDKAAGIEIVME